MSYEVQGRQYHQWFGHGTGDGVDGAGARELGAADFAAMVAAGAAVSLSGATRAGYEAFLAQGGLKALAAAVPVWAAGSGLAAGAFKRLLVGPALGGAAAAALQDVGRLMRAARDAGDLQAASGRLAAAVEAGGAEWRYGLRYAADKAGYAAAWGLVAPGELAGGGTFRVAAAPLGGEVLGTEASWAGSWRATLGRDKSEGR